MKSKKLISLIVSTSMLAGSIGLTLPTVVAHAEGVKHVAQEQNINQIEKAVITSRVPVMNGKSIIGYANAYDMATIISNNSKTYNVVTQYGLKGTVQKDAVQIVESGVNKPFTALNENGHVINVTTSLNFRTAPTVTSSVIEGLSNGTNFSIIGEQGNWFKINYDGQQGFVYKDFATTGQSQVTTTTNSEGSTVTTTTTTNSNGNKVITVTTINKNGSKVVKTTTENSNGSKEITTINTQPNGTTTTTKETVSKTGKIENKTVTTNTSSNKVISNQKTEVTSTKATPASKHEVAPTKHTEATPASKHEVTPTKPVEHNQGERTWAYDQAVSNQVENLINQFRKENGLPAITGTATTNQQAKDLAYKLAKNRTSEHGEAEMGSMLYGGNKSSNEVAQEIFTQFKNSPTHRADMLQKYYVNMSVATYKASTGYYYTGVQFVSNMGQGGWTPVN